MNDPQAKLAAFGWKCLMEHRECCADIDGGSAQEYAVATGVLVSRAVTEPCGAYCGCAEVSGFPTDCFFIDPSVRAVGEDLQARLERSEG